MDTPVRQSRRAFGRIFAGSALLAALAKAASAADYAKAGSASGRDTPDAMPAAAQEETFARYLDNLANGASGDQAVVAVIIALGRRFDHGRKIGDAIPPEMAREVGWKTEAPSLSIIVRWILRWISRNMKG